MNPFSRFSRRELLQTSSCGFGYLALRSLLGSTKTAFAGAADPKLPPFAAKAKHVIFVFLQGAPSHLDTFDYKPRLAADTGTAETPDTANSRKFLGSPFKFAQHGESGHWISELYPHLARHADKLCVLKSLVTDIPNHPQATLQMHTGSFRFARPSLGSWVLYGLGTENSELPGFIAVNALNRVGGAQNYGNAFLPSAFQATRIGSEGDDVKGAKFNHIVNSQLSSQQQSLQLKLLSDFHRERPAGLDAELDGVIQSYELAFRMQGSVPELLNLAEESPATLASYGIGQTATDNFGRQCLLARRSVEAGVRFVEITSTGWDHHQNLRRSMVQGCLGIDQPVAALLQDLEQRGLLDETLVLFGGEFGRTPTSQGDDGRDHHVNGFSMWLAGGGVKAGLSYGATNDHGIEVTEKKMHIYDLQATLLHLLGLDHEQLTFPYAGRNFRLTDVYGQVAQEILA